MNLTNLKILFFGVIFLSFTNCKVQKLDRSNSLIDNKNYYEYYYSANAVPTTTNWLRRHEAVPIIADELKNLQFKTKEYILYELEGNDKIIVDVYNKENNVGIVFNSGHFAFPDKSQRNIVVYNQDKFKVSGTIGKRKVYDRLPENIIVLQESWYWYQYQNSRNNKLVDKNTAEKILREDVREYMAKYKNK
tara:strand:- start:779 stop:1351 length:573 start_codon:yes stop_codon:yes gene_type:complete